MTNKTAKTRYIVGVIALLLGLIFNIAETWYFGWNLTASCPEEIQADYISKVIMLSGGLICWYVAIFYKESK